MAGASGTLGGLSAIAVGDARYSSTLPALRRWHTESLADEFEASRVVPGYGFDAYREQEARLFDEVRALRPAERRSAGAQCVGNSSTFGPLPTSSRFRATPGGTLRPGAAILKTGRYPATGSKDRVRRVSVKKRVAVEDFLDIPLDSGSAFSFRAGEAGQARRKPRRGLRRTCAAAAVVLCLGPLGLADAAVSVAQRAAALVKGG